MEQNELILSANIPPRTKNSFFVLGMFWIIILFQLTGLKYIWGIESISKIINTIAIPLFVFYSFYSITIGKFKPKIWLYYLIPALLILGSIFLNVTLNVLSNFQLVGFYANLVPWAAYISAPMLLRKRELNSEILWGYYYKFILCANLLGILDYILMFSGLSSLRILKTPYGDFLGGKFSLFHMLEDGAAHFRYYSCFMEPGTLAMFLLPAIAYAFFYKKYIGLAVMLVAFFLTNSLGGLFSLMLLSIILIFIVFRKKRTTLILGLFLSIGLATGLYYVFGSSLKELYEEKGNSRTIREDNFNNTLLSLPVLMIKYPIGFKLEESTADFEKNKDYLGSNFTPSNAFQLGGILAFFGYIICLIVSLWIAVKSIISKITLTLEEKVVYSSIIVLIPFIFQRPVVWDSSIFALLFSSCLIRYLSRKPKEINEI